ncbi:MAG: zf-HC2 domain-containing protein [Peptococcaceae bacterium]|nr:zf-HC2 domain-containing protein [Peptococcaceae bacterium]
MNCRKVQPLLSLFLDNEIDECTRERILRHVKRCLSCKQELVTLAKVVRIVQKSTVEPQRDYCDLFKPAAMRRKALRDKSAESSGM